MEYAVLLLALPAPTGLLLPLLPRSRLVGRVVAAAVILTSGAIAATSPAGSIQLGPLILGLTPLSRYLVLLMWGTACVVLLLSLGRENEAELRSALLVVLGTASVVPLLGNLVLATLFLQISGLSVLLALPTGSHGLPKGIHYLTLMVLADVALWFAYILLATAQPGPGETRLAGLLLAALVVGFGLKLGLVPFHIWLPEVTAEGDEPLLPLLPLGIGGLAAMGLLLNTLDAAPWLLAGERSRWFLADWGALALAGGSLLGLAQRNATRAMAYASTAAAGLLIVGLACANQAGTSATFSEVLAQSIARLLLFGSLAQFGKSGQQRPSPLWALGAMVAGAMTLLGLPPLGGFGGRWLLYSAALARSPLLALALVGGTGLLFVLLLRLPFLAPLSRAGETPRGPSTLAPKAAILVLITAALVTGLYPLPMLRLAAELARSLPYLLP